MASIDVWHYVGSDDNVRIVYDDLFDSTAIYLNCSYDGAYISISSSLQMSDILGIIQALGSILQDGMGVFEFGDGTRSWTLSPSGDGIMVASGSPDGSLVKLDIPRKHAEALANALESRWEVSRCQR